MKTKYKNNYIVLFAAVMGIGFAETALAQSAQYKRKQTSSSAPAAGGAMVPGPGTAEKGKTAGTGDSDKLDISGLEQKYWAPGDTDFSVVQNRTYSKAKRLSFSFMGGPVLNDPYNTGINYNYSLNYHFNERHGIELQYIQSKLKDSKSVRDFRALSLGGTRPDFNREVSYMGFGYNFVPFYAKMSFMGKKIIYFDMLVTPHVGISTYDQLTDAGAAVQGSRKKSFSYGIDFTQYFFLHKNFAFRFNLHNRWYSQDVLQYSTGSIQRSGDRAHVIFFLGGFTAFF